MAIPGKKSIPRPPLGKGTQYEIDIYEQSLEGERTMQNIRKLELSEREASERSLVAGETKQFKQNRDV